MHENIFLDVLHFPMRNITSHDLEAMSMGRAMSKPASNIAYSFWHDVAYRHDVKRKNLTFWLFQNYVKSNLMSKNMKMSNDMCN